MAHDVGQIALTRAALERRHGLQQTANWIN
jgi:hypothetical protein